MSSREDILRDIKIVTNKEPQPPVYELKRDIPDAGGQLSNSWQAVGGKFHRASDKNELSQILLNSLKEKGSHDIVMRESIGVNELGIDQLLSALGLKIIRPVSIDAIKTVDAGVTIPDYAIADTGTLVEITPRDLQRTVSLAPPIYIAIVQEKNILPTLHDLWPKVQAVKEKATITFITGPSRTADIEQILTIGVHGPKEAHLILIN